uniref:Uncharacterized protein n=1 Tax=Aegilops tauschii subsp. strangulata TaxID=200361 RepID=A0A453SKW5_AEGTS
RYLSGIKIDFIYLQMELALVETTGERNIDVLPYSFADQQSYFCPGSLHPLSLNYH